MQVPSSSEHRLLWRLKQLQFTTFPLQQTQSPIPKPLVIGPHLWVMNAAVERTLSRSKTSDAIRIPSRWMSLFCRMSYNSRWWHIFLFLSIFLSAWLCIVLFLVRGRGRFIGFWSSRGDTLHRSRLYNLQGSAPPCLISLWSVHGCVFTAS